MVQGRGLRKGAKRVHGFTIRFWQLMSLLKGGQYLRLQTRALLGQEV